MQSCESKMAFPAVRETVTSAKLTSLLEKKKLFSEEKWKQTVAPKHIIYHTISSNQYRTHHPVGSPSKKPVINHVSTKQKITYS